MVFDRTGRSILGHIINIFLISIIPVAVFLGSKRTDTLYNLQLPTRSLSYPLLFPSQYTLLISPLLPSFLIFNHSVTVSFINVSALAFVLAVFTVVIPSKKKKIFDIPPVPPKVDLVVKATVFILRGILL